MYVELLIENRDTLYQPIVLEDISWQTERKSAPGKLSFQILDDGKIKIEEGNAVRLRVDDNNVFFGFIFSKKTDKSHQIDITAYDQLRYLKNKDTFVYKNKTASEFIKMIAADFRLNLGVIEDTKFKIASRVEDNTSLFDMIGNALDATLMNRKLMYVLYDDFGKLALKSLDSMYLNLLIDAETGENYDYSSSIDEQTYNKIKLSYADEDAGMREIYIAQDSNHMNQWGVLQYFDTLQKEENGKAKADALLSLYNTKTRNLKLTKVFGDLRVRAGSMPAVALDLGDVKIKNHMLVEKCTHTFKESEHFMDLTLRGGDITG